MRGSRKPPNAGKGRPKGSKNKASADVRAAAQVYTDEALGTLVELMRGDPGAPEAAFLDAFKKLTRAERWQDAAELAFREVQRLTGAVKVTPPQTRAYAASAVLDRGHGRPPQAVTGERGTGSVSVTLIEELHPNG